tara:strand:- start:237 stop:509 length:273 start_codon:yes stop_codon:yes gene_type:complete
MPDNQFSRKKLVGLAPASLILTNYFLPLIEALMVFCLYTCASEFFLWDRKVRKAAAWLCHIKATGMSEQRTFNHKMLDVSFGCFDVIHAN